ncbi:hypothetical protein MA16_Dca018411 [Dendrobium catenatum]|uniref:Uncharacterized protein n=1 Tax=Dendrobium catenatum TaxID=906689 RepID=A0A2I0WHK2_9ASPA|nr:hypothetical protein MA16_Dca018411 [Dendrobium catenatum]
MFNQVQKSTALSCLVQTFGSEFFYVNLVQSSSQVHHCSLSSIKYRYDFTRNFGSLPASPPFRGKLRKTGPFPPPKAIRTSKKELGDYPLRRKRRDALPPTTLRKACIGGRFVSTHAMKSGSRSFRV